jgi:hypothetical protein
MENNGNRTIRDAKRVSRTGYNRLIMKYVLNFKSDTTVKKTNEPLECLKLHLTSIKSKMVARWGVIYLLVVERLYLSLQTKEITKKLLYYHRKYGFEAKVVLSIEVETNVYNLI